jgi:hypothetical protein
MKQMESNIESIAKNRTIFYPSGSYFVKIRKRLTQKLQWTQKEYSYFQIPTGKPVGSKKVKKEPTDLPVGA